MSMSENNPIDYVEIDFKCQIGRPMPTDRHRLEALVQLVNLVLTRVPGAVVRSNGTCLVVEDKPEAQYYDLGLDLVAEFHRAFDVEIPDDFENPEEMTNTAERPQDIEGLENYLRSYAIGAAGLGEALKQASHQFGRPLSLVRLQLIQEELSELAQAMLDEKITDIFDALVDLSYVVDGTYLGYGLGSYKVAGLREVHRSNMTKLGPDGRPIVADNGRIMKGPGYEPPRLKEVLGGFNGYREPDRK